MIEYFETNQPAFWFTVGFVLLAIETLAFGFATGLLLFAGIGGLITGGLMWADLVPQTWLSGMATFGISSGLSAVVLWKPLLKLQNPGPPAKDNSSDLVGHEFRVEQEITRQAPGKTRYSGIEWRVELADDAATDLIESGQKVAVSSVDVGVMRVKPISRETSS
jgi:membrane protein implicated in regulation of membrane protease activity